MQLLSKFFILLCAGVGITVPLTAQQWEPITPGTAVRLDYAEIVQKGDTILIRNYNTSNNYANAVNRSIDGGKTWTEVLPAAEVDLLDMLTINPYNNWIYASSGADSSQARIIKVSKNFGATWQNNFTTNDRHIMFKGDTVFCLTNAAGGPSRLKMIAPNGSIDSDFGNYPSLPFSDAFGMDADGDNLWVLTNFKVYHSGDGGLTWAQNFLVPPGMVGAYQNAIQVFAQNGEVLIADNKFYKLYYSNNQGSSWDTLPLLATPISRRDGRLYRIDQVSKMIVRFEGGAAGNWSPVTAVADFLMTTEHFGVLIGNDKTGIAVRTYGIFSKRATEETWYPVNSGFKNEEYILPFLNYRRGKLFSGGMSGAIVPPDFGLISEDNGDLWRHTPAMALPDGGFIWQNGDSLYTWKDNKMFSCADNDRYEWTKYVDLPAQALQLAFSGDTMLIRNTTKLYRSFNRYKTWELTGTVNNTELYQSRLGKFYMLRDSALYISDNVGSSWTKIYQFQHPANAGTSRFYNLGDTFLVSYTPLDRIYRSVDGGQTFDILPAPENPDTEIFRIRQHEDRLLLINGDGHIYVTLDKGQSWKDFTPPAAFSNTFNVDDHINKYTVSKEALFIPWWRIRFDGQRQVSGKVFYDWNSNNVQNSDESGANNLIVKAHQQGSLNVTHADGNFAVVLPSTPDTLSLSSAPKHFTVVPAIKVSQAGQPNPVLFALQPAALVEDVAVEMNAAAPFKAGFDNTVWIRAKNVGTKKISGVLKLVVSAPLESVGFSPQPDVIIGDTMFWNYTNLKSTHVFKVTATIMATVVPPGTAYSLWANAHNDNDDVDESDNTAQIQGEVLAAYDPNDKTVSTDEVPLIELSTAELIYTIRFQNLGNSSTDFIVVRDTLNNTLDPSSVRLVNFSHPCEWRIEEGHILVFRFNPIMLTAAASDEINSHGFVQFGVRLTDHLSPGDVISNTAHIYFDFNPAIVTNTAKTNVQTVSVSFLPAVDKLEMVAYPNPAGQSVTLALPDKGEVLGIGGIVVFDTHGRQQLLQKISGNSTVIQVDNWPEGVYWCRWQTADITYWCKIIVNR